MHAATSGMREHFPDKLHPDRVASLEMAKCAYRAMTGNSKEFQLQDSPGSRLNGGVMINMISSSTGERLI